MNPTELRTAAAIASAQGRPLAGYSAEQLAIASASLEKRTATAISTAPVQIRARILERILRQSGFAPETPRKAAPVVAAAKPAQKIASAPECKPGRLLRPSF